MTDIEQVLEELLTSHGYHTITHYHNNDKTICLTGTQVKLVQWNHRDHHRHETIIDLNHPNSLKIIEDWAKTP